MDDAARRRRRAVWVRRATLGYHGLTRPEKLWVNLRDLIEAVPRGGGAPRCAAPPPRGPTRPQRTRGRHGHTAGHTMSV